MNSLTVDRGGRLFVADVRVDLERDVLVAIVRNAPIVVEATDVPGLRRKLEDGVEGFCSTTAGRPADAFAAPAGTQALPDPERPSAAVSAHVGRAIGALPRSASAAAAMSALLPGALSLHVAPPAWKSWKRPDPDNALDAVVDTLAKKGKLKAGRCPFWRSRATVVHAVDAADAEQRRYAAARENGAEKRVRFRALAASADRLENALAEHAAIFDREWSDLWDGWAAGTREGKRENRIDGDALAVPGLRSRLDDALADARLVAKVSRVVGEAIANSEADAGKRAFVARTLVGFREIAGEPRGDGAVDFVDAAAEVAGLRDEGDPSWRATTRKILGEPQFTARRTPLPRD